LRATNTGSSGGETGRPLRWPAAATARCRTASGVEGGMPRPWRVKALRSDGQVVPSSLAAALTLPSCSASWKARSASARSVRNRLGCQPTRRSGAGRPHWVKAAVRASRWMPSWRAVCRRPTSPARAWAASASSRRSRYTLGAGKWLPRSRLRSLAGCRRTLRDLVEPTGGLDRPVAAGVADLA
jgi:hypothetical protein